LGGGHFELNLLVETKGLGENLDFICTEMSSKAERNEPPSRGIDTCLLEKTKGSVKRGLRTNTKRPQTPNELPPRGIGPKSKAAANVSGL
jgi:hypothetical protein